VTGVVSTLLACLLGELGMGDLRGGGGRGVGSSF